MRLCGIYLHFSLKILLQMILDNDSYSYFLDCIRILCELQIFIQKYKKYAILFLIGWILVSFLEKARENAYFPIISRRVKIFFTEDVDYIWYRMASIIFSTVGSSGVRGIFASTITYISPVFPSMVRPFPDILNLVPGFVPAFTFSERVFP